MTKPIDLAALVGLLLRKTPPLSRGELTELNEIVSVFIDLEADPKARRRLQRRRRQISAKSREVNDAAPGGISRQDGPD